MEENPWNVDSINAFTFLKCPECVFDTKEEHDFRDHAVENHPMSFIFFSKILKEEPFNIKEETAWEYEDVTGNDSYNNENYDEKALYFH